MRKAVIRILAISAMITTLYASDTLKTERPRFLSVKSNLAMIVFKGFSLQIEYVANKRLGYWAEATRHCEDQSMLNAALKEINLTGGINYYSSFKNCEGNKIHNGPYIGPYIKCKQGSYNESKEIDYCAFISGLQGGIQSVSNHNFIFNMGIGAGAGFFTKRKELQYSSFYDKYKLPLLDFRANISFGYMF